ncbi:hypothetical protein OUZ56_006013 [Daphnia magna]|uniref:Uncharacterized protein n=1 Tax=Daphnia magna TaxID=35525 RepID=A0ABQ9YUK9_9CRUS|nr:hypothetical protein OUZ56_006013 [Daphnia magna]
MSQCFGYVQCINYVETISVWTSRSYRERSVTVPMSSLCTNDFRAIRPNRINVLDHLITNPNDFRALCNADHRFHPY